MSNGTFLQCKGRLIEKQLLTIVSVGGRWRRLCQGTSRPQCHHCYHAISAVTLECRSPLDISSGMNWSLRDRSSTCNQSHLPLNFRRKLEKERIDSAEYDARFYPRDAMLARVFATATCLSVRTSGRPSHAGIVPSRAKAGSWNVHRLIAPWLWFLAMYESSKSSQGVTPK